MREINVASYGNTMGNSCDLCDCVLISENLKC